MTEQRWYRPDVSLPANDQKVFWMDSGGNVHEGVYRNRLWWFADMTMYIYYTPPFWKPRGEERK